MKKEKGNNDILFFQPSLTPPSSGCGELIDVRVEGIFE